LLTAVDAADAGAVVFAAFFFTTFFFDFLAVVAVAVPGFSAGADVAGAAVCANEMPASASVIVRAAMVFMMFYSGSFFLFLLKRSVLLASVI
jgi:hypothetical protein